MKEIDLSELLKLYWNKRMEIILIITIFIVIGVIYTVGFVNPVYSSSTTLVLASSNIGEVSKLDVSTVTETEVIVNSKLVSTYSELVKSKNILRKVISNLNIDIDEEILRKNIKVKAVEGTEIIKITVTNEDARIAERVANEVAKVFIDMVKEYYKIENLHIVDTAEADFEPSNINHKKDLALFAGVGIVVAAMYVFILNMFDTTIKTTEDIETIYQLPVLASIPMYEENLTKNKKGGKK